VLLALHHDRPSSEQTYEDLRKLNLTEKIKTLDSRARRKGLESLDPSRNSLISIGMEVDGNGRVTKNSYGVFNLAWQAEVHPEWPSLIHDELAAIRKCVREAHGVPLRSVVWCGMGGSAEDKAMYSAVGLLRRGPRFYVLDSTDPAKLKWILADIERRAAAPLAQALKSTLVIGMAMGMTSYEPVVNLEKMAALYERHKIDSRSNFLYMTLPNSLLDRAGKKRGFKKVELQLDGGNSTAGRHSGPLTRGSLYPLGLCGVDLKEWIGGAVLSRASIDMALQLACFLDTQARAGRNKVTLLLPKEWAGAGIWTKQDFEESLGKREDFGLKIVTGEKAKLANFHPPKSALQDRCFFAVQVRGYPNSETQKIAALRRAGYPVAVLTLPVPSLAAYMQFIHYVVFGIAWLEQMNFVTQPAVELYKTITNRLFNESEKGQGIESTGEWVSFKESPRRARWRGGVTLHYNRLDGAVDTDGKDAASCYAAILRSLAMERSIEYGELTFFGDTRYSPAGRSMRKVLDRAGDQVFRAALKMPVDIHEGPEMNHSYHEMVIGHGRALSTVLLSEAAEELKEANYTADYHRAQFLATQMALAQRGRHVVAITVRDLSAPTLAALAEFFSQTARHLCGKRTRR
jgi:glucose-6-phosphate isomerase